MELTIANVTAHAGLAAADSFLLQCAFVHPARKAEITSALRSAGAVRIWVEDNGIGIAPEHPSKFFRLFERLHTPQAYPGTGIGLALVRKGAERMGAAASSQTGARQPVLGRIARAIMYLPAALPFCTSRMILLLDRADLSQSEVGAQIRW